jgi:nicotinate-nucleotide adenylyltransferase
MRQDKLKIGILGGTFNPPHLGHLRLAEEAASLHGLDRVLFVPCFIPPHKDSWDVALPADRLEMTARACAGNSLFHVSDIEIAARGPSYTVSTLRALRNEDEHDNFFILGTDSLSEIHTWKDCRELFRLAHFIVVTRPGMDFETAWSAVPADLKQQFRQVGESLVHDCSLSLIPSPVRGLNISSTEIRDFVRAGQSIRYLVIESVLAYIEENLLYRK